MSGFGKGTAHFAGDTQYSFSSSALGHWIKMGKNWMSNNGDRFCTNGTPRDVKSPGHSPRKTAILIEYMNRENMPNTTNYRMENLQCNWSFVVNRCVISCSRILRYVLSTGRSSLPVQHWKLIGQSMKTIHHAVTNVLVRIPNRRRVVRRKLAANRPFSDCWLALCQRTELKQHGHWLPPLLSLPSETKAKHLTSNLLSIWCEMRKQDFVFSFHFSIFSRQKTLKTNRIGPKINTYSLIMTGKPHLRSNESFSCLQQEQKRMDEKRNSLSWWRIVRTDNGVQPCSQVGCEDSRMDQKGLDSGRLREQLGRCIDVIRCLCKPSPSPSNSARFRRTYCLHRPIYTFPLGIHITLSDFDSRFLNLLSQNRW